MRAFYYPFSEDFNEDRLEITGDSFHHLSVTRIRVDEDVLILNGKGTKLFGKISVIGKKSAEVRIFKREIAVRTHGISLGIALPKKEAFEDILKMATELGVKEIYPIKSEYSQYEYSESERTQRLLESALIQSNNAFFPIIHSQKTLDQFLAEHQETLIFFNSRPEKSIGIEKAHSEKTILIGPEGGFSEKEIEKIRKFKKISEIHLPTPILRAPTAAATSIGYLLALETGEK